ncbi:MAG: 4Fe-4S binding protein [Candidatus Zixiibacteriota bacterium]|nr:MAG: 4Fe-4S binding protein [candidate division Zixibacteria bacterium]
MNLVRLLPVIISFVLLSAHFLRASNIGLVVTCATLPLLLLARRRWIALALQVLLAAAVLVWISTTISIVAARNANGQPWLRLVLILGSITALTAAASLSFNLGELRRYYREAHQSALASLSAFLLTGFLLAFVQYRVTLPILMFERIAPGMGWIEILLLATYAAWVTEKMLDPAQTARWRQRIWLAFSIVFFLQLSLGLMGFDHFLMTGRLHLPVPAMIIAGPIFRGESFFMLVLFSATVVLVGPAWCSHLCYIGAWDNAASRSVRKPRKLPSWRQPVRVIILILIIISAITLRLAGISSSAATILGLAYGLGGMAVMIFRSRKTGVMTHCVAYCPISILANWLGKLSPFRIRIKDDCTECGICRLSCRYDALNMSDIKKRKPNSSCSLCGDCIACCSDGWIEYRFRGLKPKTARAIFIVLAVSLHAACLGLARI